MAKVPATVARNRDALWHQITDANQHMSEVSAAHDALQQEMMELSQEQQDVLTE